VDPHKRVHVTRLKKANLRSSFRTRRSCGAGDPQPVLEVELRLVWKDGGAQQLAEQMVLWLAHDAIAPTECGSGRLSRAYSSRVKAARVISQTPRAGTTALCRDEGGRGHQRRSTAIATSRDASSWPLPRSRPPDRPRWSPRVLLRASWAPVDRPMTRSWAVLHGENASQSSTSRVCCKTGP
jgi:hypothetical protein